MNMAINDLRGSRVTKAMLNIFEGASEPTGDQVVFISRETVSTEKMILAPSSSLTTSREGTSDFSPEIHFAIQSGEEITPGYKVIQRLPLILEFDDDGTYIVHDSLFDEYGTGTNFQEAKQSYLSNLVDYYQMLSGLATDDNSPTQALSKHLQQFIAEVNK